MAEESDLEKTEEPTSRRLEQAREQGQVPHSRELGTFLVLIVAAASFWMMGSWFAQRSMGMVRKGLMIDPLLTREPAQMLPRLVEVSGDALLTFSPLLGLLVLAALLPPFFLNAWVFAPKSIAPDINRLNPLTGFGRMFSWNSLMELGKALLKALLVGGVAIWVLWKALFAKSVVKHDFRWPRPATERVSVQQLIHGPSSETIPDNLRDSV